MEQEAIVLDLVHMIRNDLPRVGSEKLHFLLTPTLRRSGIKMGRDKLHNLLLSHGLTIKRKKPRPRTTNSDHWMKKYPNLIAGLEVTFPGQVLVSDITYVDLLGGDFSYLSLVTDAYSRMILGWALSTSLRTEEGPSLTNDR